MHTLVSLILVHIARVASGNYTGLQPPQRYEWELLSSLAFHVSQKIVSITNVKLFYVVEMKSYPRFTDFIHALHETSIQTISISNQSKIASLGVPDHGKNIIFTLDDVSEILDLIFYTISRAGRFEQEDKLIKTPMRNEKEDVYQKEVLPQYCIKVDGRFLWLKTAERKKCSREVSVTSRELDDASTLSDQVFNLTRGLFLSKIWNSKNHLIFLVKSFGHITKRSTLNASRNVTLMKAESVSGALFFCFKFFWRFFKGHKAVICHPNGCERYDPFTETLISFQEWEEADETFFDFSLRNMHKKPLRPVFDFSEHNGFMISSSPSWCNWYSFQATVVTHLASSVNGTIANYFSPGDIHVSSDEALKYGFDMIMYPSGTIVAESEYSKLDFTVGFDTSILCIVAPHSSYMSQGLVIFKSFSPVVWGFIFVTIVLFCYNQYIFHRLQHRLFHRLYTNSEIDYYRNASSLLMLYAYFICGSPPSLHLGRLFSGKILFVIYSFSALIISTVFLSGMTTLLSDKVRYPEIDSLKSLEESDLFIQSDGSGKSEITSLFNQLNQSETMKAKITDSYDFYLRDVFIHDIAGNKRIISSINGTSSDEKVFGALLKQFFGVRFEEMKENFRTMAEEDAFLVSLPYSATPKENLRRKLYYEEFWVEYHVIKECLITYPLIGASLKNSFYFELYNQLVAQYFETGHARRILVEETSLNYMYIKGSEALTAENSEDPRPFNLNDLQSAFIGLVVGLFLSFLAFVGEILMDIFPHSAAVKFLMRLENLLS
ncbi:unnamed protein product [Bemisia tabaci]|uniref:Ionotropic receptor n=1 Tax=Bemisia tabaci TaxID=7038 RepID=A0A9P0A425_BEMTA|nr:unnamed protein product [Bemisia tabaci]